MFCAPCRLFGGSGSMANDGFKECTHTRLREHEDSTSHKQCTLTMLRRGNIECRIDSSLLKQQHLEKQYWREVLKRVVAVVKSLSSRGLAFRGTDESFGSSSNGNYLMRLELLLSLIHFSMNILKNMVMGFWKSFLFIKNHMQ